MNRYTFSLIVVVLSVTASQEEQVLVSETGAAQDHFLFRVFDLPQRDVESLPLPVQQYLTSFLPNLYKPLNPKPLPTTIPSDDLLDVGILLGATTKMLIIDSNGNSNYVKDFKEDRVVGRRKLCPLEFNVSSQDGFSVNESGTKCISHFDCLYFEIDEKGIILASQYTLIEPKQSGSIADVFFLPNGIDVLVATEHKHIYRFNTRDRLVEILYQHVERGGRYTASISPDGTHVAFSLLRRTDRVWNGERLESRPWNGPTPEGVELYDVTSGRWSTMPGVYPREGLYKQIGYIADSSLFYTLDTKEALQDKAPHSMQIWDLAGDKPKAIRSTLFSNNSSLARHENKYNQYILEACWHVNDSTTPPGYKQCYVLRIIHAKTGVVVLQLVLPSRPNGTQWSADSRFLLVNFGRHSHGVILNDDSVPPLPLFSIWEWNTWYDDLAQSVAQPLSILHYLFICYLHRVGQFGLTVNDKGLCPRDNYKERFLVVNGVKETDIAQLKAVYQSFSEPLQRYLLLKYQLQWS